MISSYFRLGAIVSSIPNTLVDGTVCDAVPLMANFNSIISQVNANAVPLPLTLPAPTAPTLLNGWTNTGGSALASGYYIDAFGIVHLQGSVSPGAALTIFTLPVGYRPLGIVTFAAGYGTPNNNITIDTSGNVSASVLQVTRLDIVSFRTT